MYQENLTKEERMLIKRGRAYRSWKKRIIFGIVIFFLWAFCGLPLVHMNSITKVIYTIGLLIALGVEYYVLILSCWKCPECHTKLPKKSMLTSGYTPYLVKNCPNCGADLAK